MDAISGAPGSDATGTAHLVFPHGTVDGSFTVHLYGSFDPAAVDPACAP